MSLLEVRHLAKRFGGVAAVDDVSFALSAGEILALIGPNGAGKSTCFNMLNGQIRPDRGAVELNGRAVGGLSPARMARAGVGRTFQITETFVSMSVRENVQLALLAQHRQIWRWWSPARRAHVAEAEGLLAQTGMADQAERAAGELSYGDLKRLELTIALAAAPRLLLMDEPTAGMAAAERLALMAVVRRLSRERGMAVLFTEHDMEAVFATADRVLVLHQGRIIADGAPGAVRADARVRDVYLGAAG